MLKVCEIVKGPQFPESVEIKKCEQLDDTFFIIEALGRQTKNYYELMLEQRDIELLERLSSRNEHEGLVSARELQHFLQCWAFQVADKYAFSRALGGRNLLPLPHQIEAVYGSMLQVPQIRFLLADDPGAGKTIMAGMLMKELRARQNVERVLILVPPLVLRQWQEEMTEKFNLQFVIINRQILRAGGKNPFVEHDYCLASMYWVARDDIKSFINEADFDLIIVDEAHKMAAYTHGKLKKKISRTKLYQLGEMLLRHVDHCLLLTATPHKGDVENFRHLMSLVDHDIFSNVSANESLKEKSNPYIIRRLKESLKNFDGTPLFPRRTTKTLEYTLADRELELYEAVTNYVRHNFNRAINKGSNSTAFAMMLLQRRLSSSIEAIHLSLERRRERLSQLLDRTLEERKKFLRQLQELDLTDFNDEALDYQQELEEKLEQATDKVDPEELQLEIAELDKLISQSSYLCMNTVERKYQELEVTLFGIEGLLNQGEKILIFTESADTLHYLEKRLLERVSRITKITGNFSMDERLRQVELFRNECQIMLATDAGGESINLQFCNQCINYDIPWNPNRLEQRMGRIHRIGQKNEVFVFNLVARNTREGDVMIRLLDKMEQMRQDLGTDLVYDFIGEILEDNYYDLPTLMQEAILNRESLDDIIAKMDKTLSKEHEKLIELVKKERMDEAGIDLPGMRREQYDLVVKRIPIRCNTNFVQHILTHKKIRIYESNEEKVKRIERLPKFIRDFARKQKVPLKSTAESYRFTGYKGYESEEVELMSNDHPIFKLAIELTNQESEKFALERYMVAYPTPEPLNVEIFSVSVADGTRHELTNELVYLAKRQDQSVLALDPYWLFQSKFTGECVKLGEYSDSSLLSAALRTTTKIRGRIRDKREAQLDKISTFLQRAFQLQYNDILEKLAAYQNDNKDNRNSALINQMNAALIDIEARRDERINQVERQKNVIMKPPKRLAQLELMPNGKGHRVLAIDYKEIVEQYEHANGRRNVKMYDAFGLVDFYSERYNGDARFIIIADRYEDILTDDYLEDLYEILDKTFMYYVRNGEIVEERALFDIFEPKGGGLTHFKKNCGEKIKGIS